MGNTTTGAGRSRVFRPLILPIAALLVAGMLPALGAGARVGPEPRAAGEPWATLVRTVGFRSASAAHLGEYAAIGNFNENIDPNIRNDHWEGSSAVTVRDNVNAVSTVFGLFVEEGRRFRLLGANGFWVEFVGPSLRAEATATDWDSAWSFRVRRPRVWDLPQATRNELHRSRISPRLAVCVEVFDPTGNSRGWLSYRSTAISLDGHPAYPVALSASECGGSTATLFLTDALPKGTPVRNLTVPVAGYEIDPLDRARFVPLDARGPHRPGGQWRAVADDGALADALEQVHDYFYDGGYGIDSLNDDLAYGVNDLVVATTLDIVADVSLQVSLPGEEVSIDPMATTIDVLAGAAKMIPEFGARPPSS